MLLDSVGKYTRIGDAERVRHWLETGNEMPGAIKRGGREGEIRGNGQGECSGTRSLPADGGRQER